MWHICCPAPPPSAKSQAPKMRCSSSPPAGSAIVNSFHLSSPILSVNCSENHLHHLKSLNSLLCNKHIPYYYYHRPLQCAHRAAGDWQRINRRTHNELKTNFGCASLYGVRTSSVLRFHIARRELNIWYIINIFSDFENGLAFVASDTHLRQS
jgi:hypothetical protein